MGYEYLLSHCKPNLDMIVRRKQLAVLSQLFIQFTELETTIPRNGLLFVDNRKSFSTTCWVSSFTFLVR